MENDASHGSRAVPLAYDDDVLRVIDMPGGRLTVTRGLGSGLARRAGDPPGTFWAVGDRGPNLKIGVALERFGLRALNHFADVDGAKLMPCLDIGPAMSELRIEGDRVILVRTLPPTGESGRPVTGLPTPGGPNVVVEPGVTLDGALLPPDPSGADTEGIAATADGGFWVGDEYGPSLLRLAADGRVMVRWVPRGSEGLFAGADYPVLGVLPAIAARRRLNRGFEAIGLSPDDRWLYLAFQSPLAHPDVLAFERGRHARVWKLDAATGEVVAQHLYPLDRPRDFLRDRALGEVHRSDVKISELAVIGPDRLLMLERVSQTTKLYAVDLSASPPLDRVHLDIATRPTLEERSAGDIGMPVLAKTPVLDTDELPRVDADLEGLIQLSPSTLLLVNDNDFGVEGVATRFWRIELAHPL